MNKKLCICLICALVLIICSFYMGFKLGTNKEKNIHEEEASYNIQLNKSDLDGLGEIDGTIYVTGHKSPDSDTMGSSIAYAALLRELGYDAKPVVLGRVNNESAYILEAAGVETPELLEDASGLNMVLVDHSEYTQSADGLEDANVLMIIDHHGDGSVYTGNPLIYDARPIGSACTIVWLRYRNYGLTPDKQSATVLMGGILSDTKNLESNTTTFADREAVKTLSKIAKITDIDTFYQDMYKAAISYEGMTDEEIFFSDYKEYENGGVKYVIGCVNAYTEKSAQDLIARMKEVMPAALEKNGMDMGFTLVHILHDDLSMTFVVGSDEDADDILAEALRDIGVYDGTSYKITPYASRKKIIVPALVEVFESHPKE
ncbi:MAG: DHH family phosphoesterase [Pseudobutyrivibrio sp.]|nr:DHH family phosphoesterase [Pseudobutyrivibrio sp.]